MQKGQFLHVVDFDVSEGTNVVAPELSNLPGEWNPDAGMWIPRIAVYDTFPDEVFNVLREIEGILIDNDASAEIMPQRYRQMRQELHDWWNERLRDVRVAERMAQLRAMQVQPAPSTDDTDDDDDDGDSVSAGTPPGLMSDPEEEDLDDWIAGI